VRLSRDKVVTLSQLGRTGVRSDVEVVNFRELRDCFAVVIAP
jgi:hypothetical protein